MNFSWYCNIFVWHSFQCFDIISNRISEHIMLEKCVTIIGMVPQRFVHQSCNLARVLLYFNLTWHPWTWISSGISLKHSQTRTTGNWIRATSYSIDLLYIVFTGTKRPPFPAYPFDPNFLCTFLEWLLVNPSRRWGGDPQYLRKQPSERVLFHAVGQNLYGLKRFFSRNNTRFLRQGR